MMPLYLGWFFSSARNAMRALLNILNQTWKWSGYKEKTNKEDHGWLQYFWDWSQIGSQSGNVFTSQYMNVDWDCISQTWWAGIGARIRRFGMLNHKETGCHVALFSDDAYTTSWGIIRNDGVIMPPKYVRWGFWAVCDDTWEIHSAALFEVNVRAAQDCGFGFCNCQSNNVTYGRCGRNLTSIFATISMSCWLNLK